MKQAMILLVSTMLIVASFSSSAHHDQFDAYELETGKSDQPRVRRDIPNIFESMWIVNWELLAIGGVITGIGLKNWDWGSSNSFRRNDEGWFSKSTGSGGMDKLGHGFTAYAISEGLRYQMLHSEYYYDHQTAALHAALFSAAFMTYIEIFDGYSEDHGFAKEDMIANAAGIGFSYLRGVFPKLEEIGDYRIQYWPSGHDGINIFGDYEGQNFRLVFKPAGLDFLKNSIVRYLEFHIGYEATGFDRGAGFNDTDRRRKIFLGLGLNFDELFFKARRHRAGWVETTTAQMVKYIQPKWTTLDVDAWED